MKSIRKIVALVIIAFSSSCSSTQQASTTPDDVYYSKNDPQPSPPPSEQPQAPSPAVSHSSPEQYSKNNSDYNPDPLQNNSSYSNSESSSGQSNGSYSSSSDSSTQNGNNYITNNYYGDDNYDYAYSARLRRYYSPMAGYGYYDPYYTNSYWYDYNPYSYGFSIYLGYHWCSPLFGLGYGFGYGYPFYSPFYGGLYGGYYNPYFYNPYYYNSFEGLNNYHYGPRRSIRSGVGRSITPTPGPRTLGETYQRAVTENRVPNVSAGRVRGFDNSSVSPVRTNVDLKNNIRQPTAIRSEAAVKNVVSGGGGETEGRMQQSTSKGMISAKNEIGGSRVPSNSLSGRGGEVSPIPENNGRTVVPFNRAAVRENGGTVRPNFSRPQNNNVQGSPNRNSTNLRSRTNQPLRNNQPFHQNNNRLNAPENNNQRARSNFNYDRPRQMQESQPRFEQRQELRQFRQENIQPHQQGSFSAPQRSSSPSGGGGGGRSSGSSGRGSGGRR